MELKGEEIEGFEGKDVDFEDNAEASFDNE